MKDSSSVMAVTIPQLLDKVTQAATGSGHIQVNTVKDPKQTNKQTYT